MKKPQTPQQRKRGLILRLRRTVRVQRRFDVVLLDNGLERHTCRTCGTSEDIDPFKGQPVDPAFRKKLAAYRACGGVTGICKHCSQERAKERFPLP